MSYREFMKRNTGKSVDEFDYLHFVMRERKLTANFFQAFVQVNSPKFEIIEDKLFRVSRLVEESRDDLAAQGASKDEVQYWSNLVDLTGVFEGWEASLIAEIAEVIATNWNHRICSNSSLSAGRAIVIFDTSCDEVYLTISDDGQVFTKKQP